jgi:hypothetical protein
MTSVFEVLSNKEALAEDDLVQSAIQTKKEDEPTSQKYFIICRTCFWCASYIDIMDNMDALPYKVCPTCNHTAIELLPLSDNEHYDFEYTATRGVILELNLSR